MYKRQVYGDENENYGALYEVSNQKTLGISEKEILDLVTRVALQLSAQEAQVRKMAMEKHGLECEMCIRDRLSEYLPSWQRICHGRAGNELLY